MKNTFLLLFLSIISSTSFGQMYLNANSNQSITITPQGIRGKFPANTTEPSNVSLGRNALSVVTNGSQNTAVGDYALYSNTGSQNSAFGADALTANTTGILNSALGNGAMNDNKTGSENTAIGAFSLNSNTSLSRNVAVGYFALNKQSYNGNNNSENTAVGYLAMNNNNPTDATNGRFNTGIGAHSMASNITGASNTALGYQSMFSHQMGDDNVALGHKALYGNTAGIKNVAIGNSALANTTGSGNVGIGYMAGYNESGSDKLYISNNETISPLIGGDFAAKKVAINRDMVAVGVNDFRMRTEALQVGGEAFKTMGNGNWQFASDRRLKKNITALNSQEMLNKVLKMQGVTYEMKDSSQTGIQYGFIAQELREVFPTKVKENAAGYLSADYGSYDAIIVESIKALNERIDGLEKKKTLLDSKHAQLSADIEAITKRMEKFETLVSEKQERQNADKK